MNFVRLKDILSIHKGRKNLITSNPSKDSIRVLQIDDLRNDQSLKYTDEKKGVWVTEDDLMIAWDGANAGTIGYGKTGYVGSTIAALKKIEPRKYNTPFLGYFLRSQFEFFQKNATGATIPHIDRKSLENLLIPALSLEDQIRVATVLSKVEALITLRKESISLLDEFLKSTFLEMFGDSVQNNKEWKTLRLGSKIKMKHGFAFKSEYFSDNGEFVLLTPGNFNEEGGFRDRGERQKFYTGEIPQEYILNKDDLLLAMTEQAPGLLGSPLLVPDSGRFLHNQRLGLVTFGREDFNERFLFHLFNTKGIRTRIHAKATGTKVRHTSPGKIEELIIYQPPIGLQNRFGGIVLKIEKLKSQFENSLRELEGLFSSLSQLAFKKELDLNLLQTDADVYISVISETEVTKTNQRRPNRETFESKQVESVAMQAVANRIIQNYKGFHFSFEMLYSFIEREELNYTEYFSSEEMKKNPQLNVNPDNVEDLKNFVASAIVNRTTDEQAPKNPWIKLNQIFYDASKPSESLNLKLEDLENSSNRSIEDQSGIYFEIVS